MAEEKSSVAKDAPPDVLEADIARTRKQLSGTVSEIQERLSPAHMKDEAKEKLRESTVDRWKDAASRFGTAARERGANVMDTIRSSQAWDTIKNSSTWDAVRSNPLPVIMIGAGAAWLVFNRNRGTSSSTSDTMSSLSSKAGELTDTAQAKMSELSGQAKQAGSEFASKASRSASRLGSSAKDRARMASSRFNDTIQENPLGVALAALGIGALMGFTIPESGKEKQMMGSASDALLSRAKETAQRAFHKAQHAAERAVQTAGEELKKDAA
jgi:ElaB/YqjD/DUF883 family membrane-anchored ribosome-binding protein